MRIPVSYLEIIIYLDKIKLFEVHNTTVFIVLTIGITLEPIMVSSKIWIPLIQVLNIAKWYKYVFYMYIRISICLLKDPMFWIIAPPNSI